MHYAGFYSSGFASIDTLRIGDLTIKDQSFEEATLLKPVPLWDDIFDTVLGLSRLRIDYRESSLRATSPFHNMISQGVLQRNLFSLKLSESESNRSGEILLGSINTNLYVEPLETFPISESYSSERGAGFYLGSGWQVHAHSITYGFKTHEIRTFPLGGYVAAFSTQYPWISFPREIGEHIIESLGPDSLNRVDCARRDILPHLTIRLGHGTSFVLKAHDYIRRNPQFKLEFTDLCQIEIIVHEEPEDGTKYIVLGSVFLARWYSVFDYDNAQISCKKLPCS